MMFKNLPSKVKNVCEQVLSMEQVKYGAQVLENENTP